MTRNKIAILVLSIFVCFNSTSYASDTKKGEQDFRTYCASCHGISGRGDGYVARDLTKKPADLTTLSQKAGGKFPHNRVKSIIDGRSMPRTHGTGQMPIWGNWFSLESNLSGRLQEDREGIAKEVNQRLENLLSYLKTLQK